MEYSRKHLMYLVLALLFWGTSFPVMKYALATNHSYTIVFYRFFFSFLLLLPYFFFHFRKYLAVIMKNKQLFLLGILNFFGMNLQIAGMNYTTSTKSVIITQMLIVAVPIPAYFLLNEKLDIRKAIGIFFSMAGAIILSTNLQFEGMFAKGTAFGDILTLAAVLFFAVFIVITRKLTNDYDAFILLFPSVAGTFILSIFPVAIVGKMATDTVGFFSAIFLAIFCTIIPTMMYNYSLRQLDAITSTIMGPVEIISAVVLAMIFLGETLTLVEIGGGVLILFSIYIVAVKKKKKNPVYF